MEDLYPLLIAFGVNSLATIYVSVRYFSSNKLLATFKKAVDHGINHIDLNGESQQQVVVQGKVKSIGPPIKSVNKSNASGVMQLLTVKEFIANRSYGPGGWDHYTRLLDLKNKVVPFKLECPKFKIIITSPLEADHLDLDVVSDEFEPLPVHILGLIFGGIHRKGIQRTEFLLKEGSILTGFGEVVKEKNGALHLIPPKNGMSYILTTMDPESLANKLASEKEHYRNCLICLCVLGISLIGFLSYKLWNKRAQQRRVQEMTDLARRARMERRRNNPHDEPLNEQFACTICITRPREIVLLPCGHICMCVDCFEQYPNSLCPLCRQRFTSSNLVYLS